MNSQIKSNYLFNGDSQYKSYVIVVLYNINVDISCCLKLRKKGIQA